MLLQMQVWAFMLLQEAGAPGWDFRHSGTDGYARQSGRHRDVPDVGMVHRRDDRSFDGIQCRAQTEPGVRTGSGRRAARRQTGRSDQDRGSLQEEPPGEGRCRRLQEFQAHQGSAEISG